MQFKLIDTQIKSLTKSPFVLDDDDVFLHAYVIIYFYFRYCGPLI